MHSLCISLYYTQRDSMLRSLSAAIPFIQPLTSKEILSQLSSQKRSERKTTPKLKGKNIQSIDVVKPYYYLTHERQQIIKTEKQFRYLSEGETHDYLHRKKIENRTKIRKVSRNYTTQIQSDTTTFQGWREKPYHQQYLPRIKPQKMRTEGSQNSRIKKKTILGNSYNNVSFDREERVKAKSGRIVISEKDIESLVNVVKQSAKRLTLFNKRKESENVQSVMIHLKNKEPVQADKTLKYADRMHPKAKGENILLGRTTKTKQIQNILTEQVNLNFRNSDREETHRKVNKIVKESPYKQSFTNRVSRLVQPKQQHKQSNLQNQRYNKSFDLTYNQTFMKSKLNPLRPSEKLVPKGESKITESINTAQQKCSRERINQTNTLGHKVFNQNETLVQQSFQSSLLESESLLSSQPYIQNYQRETEVQNKIEQQDHKIPQQLQVASKQIGKENQQHQQEFQTRNKGIVKRSRSSEIKQIHTFKSKLIPIRKSNVSSAETNQKLISPSKHKTSSIVTSIMVDQILQFDDEKRRMSCDNRHLAGKKSFRSDRISNNLKQKPLDQHLIKTQGPQKRDISEQIKEYQPEEEEESEHEKQQQESEESGSDGQKQGMSSRFHKKHTKKPRRLKLGQGFIDSKGVNLIKQQLAKLQTKQPKLRRVGRLLNVQKIEPIETQPKVKPEEAMRDFILNLKKKKRSHAFNHDNIAQTDRPSAFSRQPAPYSWSLSSARREVITLMTSHKNTSGFKQLHQELIQSFNQLDIARRLSYLPHIPQYYEMNTVQMTYDNIYDNQFQKSVEVTEPSLNFAKRQNFIVDFYLQNQVKKAKPEDEGSECDFIPSDIWELYEKDKSQTQFKKAQDDLAQTHLVSQGRICQFSLCSSLK